ncbi:MAG: HEAT repeat domain-containing protein [Anaerolineaceae bacterium]
MGQNSNIQEVIKHLLDQKNPFPATMLYQLSDLSREDCRALRGVWNNLPLTRRRSLMEDLVNLSESDHLLMFEEVGKIALDDPDPEVLISAIDLLFQAEDEHLVPVFLKLLQQPQQNDRVRAAAANALGPYVFLGEIEELQPELLRTIEDALLKAYAEDVSDLVRRRALESLGYSSREEVPPLLRSASASPEAAWIESAMFAMGKSADDQWQDLVLDNLDHEDLNVRIQAIHAAGELSLNQARQSLIKVLNQELIDQDIRHKAIWALSQIGGEDIESLFERLLEETGDEDEMELLEESLDELNFTNDKANFDLLDVEFQDLYGGIDHNHHHAEEEDLDDAEDLEQNEDETFDRHSKGYDQEGWQRYVDDDDDNLVDDEEFDDFDEQDDSEEDIEY